MSYESASPGAISAIQKPDISFIKQFLIEFSFIKCVAEQELIRVKDLGVDGTADRLDQVEEELNLEQKKCH